LDLEIIFWALVAAVAFFGEVLTVSFFLLFFALGAFVALGIALLGAGITLQVAGFVVASVLSMILLRPALLHRISFRDSERYEPRGGIMGKSGVVVEAIEPDSSGTVKIGAGEFWTARSLYPGQRIESGSRVRVLDTDGLTALVEIVGVEGGE
jgi:membrane protein implicated in regulation of membrane protease activity